MTKNMVQTTPKTDPLQSGYNLRVSVLAPRLGISKNQIWRLVRQGKFPRPINLEKSVKPNLIIWMS